MVKSDLKTDGWCINYGSSGSGARGILESVTAHSPKLGVYYRGWDPTLPEHCRKRKVYRVIERSIEKNEGAESE